MVEKDIAARLTLELAIIQMDVLCHEWCCFIIEPPAVNEELTEQITTSLNPNSNSSMRSLWFFSENSSDSSVAHSGCLSKHTSSPFMLLNGSQSSRDLICSPSIDIANATDEDAGGLWI